MVNEYKQLTYTSGLNMVAKAARRKPYVTPAIEYVKDPRVLSEVIATMIKQKCDIKSILHPFSVLA